MPGPFIFIATNRLKAGQLERERSRVPGLVDFIEAGEPRLIAFNEYVNDAGDEVTVVQVHPRRLINGGTHGNRPGTRAAGIRGDT
jgi:hypothetical protein